jgi:DNA-binding transcriptional LysR family regulator
MIVMGDAQMLRQLKYVQSVVRLNSFSEAAEENFISQSAISQQVQALERELDFQLLILNFN